MPTSPAPKSPFKFLDAYTAQDKALFFGRETEQKRLVELIFRSRLILVYGQSGTGKSSLVQCGLAQVLSESDYFPIVVRRRGDLPTALRNTLQSFFDADDLPSTDAVELVAQLSGYVLRPVYLVFDQFEELFISGNPDEQRQFFATLHALYQSPTSCKLLLVMREDYIANLYPYEDLLPGLFDFRLRVEPMSERSLHEVIVQTCRHVDGVRLEDEAQTVRQILDNNQDAKSTFQLPYLQVYLDQLWRTAHEMQPEGIIGGVVFNPALVDRVGAIDDVLERFLSEQKKVVSQQLEPPDPTAVNHVLEAFVTYEGTRREQRFDALQTSTGLEPARLRAILDKLERSRLLRQEEGTYELAHDSLAKIIDKSRSTEQRQINDILRRLKEAYQEFGEKNGASDLLLSPRRLAEIQLFPTAIRAELNRSTPNGEAVWAFVNASQAHHERQQFDQLDKQRRRNKRLKLTVFGVSTLLVLALVSMFFAFVQWENSNIKSLMIAVDGMDPVDKLIAVAWAYEQDGSEVTARKLAETFYNNQFYISAFDHQLMSSAQFTPDGRSILTTTANKIYVWDSTGVSILDSLHLRGVVQSVVSARDSQTILVTSGKENTEAHVWNRRSKRVSKILAPTAIQSAELSADGQSVLTTNGTATVTLWNGTGHPVGRLQHTSGGAVGSAGFSPDGKTVFTTGDGGGAYFWNRATRQVLALDAFVASWTFAPDGKRVLYTTTDDKAWAWNGTEVRLVQEFGATTQSVQLAENGYFTALQPGNDVSVYNPGGELVSHFVLPFPVESVRLSPDGEILLTVSRTNRVNLWSRQGLKLAEFYPLDEVASAEFSPDGWRVLTRTDEGRTHLWDRRDSRVQGFSARNAVQLVRPSADGKTVLTVTESAKVTLWNHRGTPLNTLVCAAPVSAAALSPDGTLALVATEDGRARLWFPTEKRSVALLTGKPVAFARLSADGHTVLTVSPGGRFYFWNEKGARIGDLVNKKRVSAAELAPDGGAVLIVDEDQRVSLWNRRDNRRIPLPHDHPVLAAGFSPDGRSVLTTLGNGGGVQVWNRQGVCLDSLRLRNLDIEFAELSADESRVLVTTLNGAHVWDRATNRLFTLKHRTAVRTAQFAADGETILTTGSRGDVHLWTASGRRLASLEEQFGEARFLPDGTHFLTVTQNQVKIWPAPNAILDWVKHDKTSREREEILAGLEKRYQVDTAPWRAFIRIVID